MSPSEDATTPGAGLSGGGNGVQVGGTDRRPESTAWPPRPTLSATGERLLTQLKPGTTRQVVKSSPPRAPRIGEQNITGQLELKVPKRAMPWEIRRAFSSLANLPDGVTVVVKLRARQVVDLADALGGLDDLPSINLVVTGPVTRFEQVAAAVSALRSSAARQAAELRAVAS